MLVVPVACLWVWLVNVAVTGEVEWIEESIPLDVEVLVFLEEVLVGEEDLDGEVLDDDEVLFVDEEVFGDDVALVDDEILVEVLFFVVEVFIDDAEDLVLEVFALLFLVTAFEAFVDVLAVTDDFGALQAPVIDGTASVPEPIATTFVPQFAALAKWRFPLS